jgi:hypothetical protein
MTPSTKKIEVLVIVGKTVFAGLASSIWFSSKSLEDVI